MYKISDSHNWGWGYKVFSIISIKESFKSKRIYLYIISISYIIFNYSPQICISITITFFSHIHKYNIYTLNINDKIILANKSNLRLRMFILSLHRFSLQFRKEILKRKIIAN